MKKVIYIFTIVCFTILFVSFLSKKLFNGITILSTLNLIIIFILILKEGLFKPVFLYSLVIILPIISHIEVLLNENPLRYYKEASFFMKNVYLNKSLQYLTIWNILFLIAYNFSKRISVRKIKFYRLLKRNKLPFILIIIQIIIYIIIVRKIGGISGLVKGLSTRVETYAGLHYYIIFIKIGLVSAILYINEKKKRKAFLTILLTFLMMASFGGRTSAFFGVLVPFLIYYTHEYNNLNLKQLLLIGVCGVLFSQIILKYRHMNATSEYKNILAQKNSNIRTKILEISRGKDTANINAALIGKIENNIVKYQYGKTYLGLLSAPIPRKIYINKPLIDDTGMVGRDLMKNEEKHWGLPPQQYGLIYYNFGLLGIILYSLFCGILSGVAYKQLMLDSKNIESKIFYCLTYNYYFNFFSTKATIDFLAVVVFILGSCILIDIILNKLFK